MGEIDHETLNLAIENHELGRHRTAEDRLSAMEIEVAGLRAELATHRDGAEHHGHSEEEFEEVGE